MREVLPSTSPTTRLSCAMTQRSCRVALMRYLGRRGAAFFGPFLMASFLRLSSRPFWEPLGCWFGTFAWRHFNPLVGKQLLGLILVPIHQISSSADLFALRRASLH